MTTDAKTDMIKFILCNQASSAVACLDACFCSLEGENELCNDEAFMGGLAACIAEKCSAWQIENAIVVLKAAHGIAAAKKPMPGVQDRI